MRTNLIYGSEIFYGSEICKMNRKLYNYMPLKYFNPLIFDGLYFRLASKFEDKKEGNFPAEQIVEIESDIQKVMDQLKINDEAISEECKKLILSMIKGTKTDTFINCWHQNNVFNKAMWDTYAKNGLYIQTSPHRIFESMSTEFREIFEIDGAEVLMFFKPHYIAESKKVSKDVVLYMINHLNSHILKNLSYQDENELRLIIKGVRFRYFTGDNFNEQGNSPKTVSLEKTISLKHGYSLEKQGDKVTGIYIKIDPKILIERIGIVGGENKKCLHEVLDKININCPIDVH